MMAAWQTDMGAFQQPEHRRVNLEFSMLAEQFSNL